MYLLHSCGNAEVQQYTDCTVQREEWKACLRAHRRRDVCEEARTQVLESEPHIKASGSVRARRGSSNRLVLQFRSWKSRTELFGDGVHGVHGVSTKIERESYCIISQTIAHTTAASRVNREERCNRNCGLRRTSSRT